MKRSLILSAILSLTVLATSASAAQGIHRITLKDNWDIQSSAEVNEGGAVISSGSFRCPGWHAAAVPSTVLGTLVADGIFKDPFHGRNLDRIPDSLFSVPWWYRTVFELPQIKPDFDHVVLKFLGINYRADIWLNGHMIASSDSVLGGFRQFNFDVTDYVHFGGRNVLAVKIYKPGPGSLTLGFVDWSPEPPDRDMGLWRPVELHISGDVAIHHPFVASEVDTATLKKAELTVSTVVKNNVGRGVIGTLTGTIGTISFSRIIKLRPFEKKNVAFKPEEFHQLIIKNPRLWWTHDFGTPNLYSLRLNFSSGGVVTDSKNVEFGIRQINDYINSKGFRGYKLNGQKILIRGGGWADQIFLQQDKRKLEAELDYAVNMHLNAIRMEGFWGENSDIFRLCDEKGILIMAGFSCQWEWKNLFGADNDEYGCIRSPRDMKLAAESFKDQILWLRNHPSIFVWLYGSDLHPRPGLEKMYQTDLSQYDTTRPFLSSAAEHTSILTGPSAVKMRGPYDYVPPVYWYADTSHGGAFGFNTETSPGAEVPRTESLRRMLSPDSLWPINTQWYFHCSRGIFRNLKRYNAAIDGRLGTPKTLSDYERKAQFINYEGMRAMFEAFGAEKFTSTGVVQWMYNSAWPKMWWQLFDYYLDPTGAFYGAQEACKPIHVVYDYATRGIYVVNSTLRASEGITVSARVLNFDMKDMFRLQKTMNSAANTSEMVTALPRIKSLTPTYFVDLRLYKGTKLLNDNLYALSTKPDSLIEKKSTYYVTASSYANLKELNDLPQVKLQQNQTFEKKGDLYDVTVRLHNPTDHLAFMVYLSVRKGSTANSVLPIFWDDNYISLQPGETRTVRGYFHTADLRSQLPRLELSGWNIMPYGK